MLKFWCFPPDCLFSGSSPAFHFLPLPLLLPRRNFPPTSLFHLLKKKNAPWLLGRRRCYLLPQNRNHLLCHFAGATWVPFSILSSWALVLVAPCNPVMEPHLKARWIPQRTISLKQSHYQCLSMYDWHSNATGRSSVSARGHQGEVLPSTLTSSVPFPACWTTASSLLFSYLCLAPSCQFVCCYKSTCGLWYGSWLLGPISLEIDWSMLCIPLHVMFPRCAHSCHSLWLLCWIFKDYLSVFFI